MKQPTMFKDLTLEDKVVLFEALVTGKQVVWWRDTWDADNNLVEGGGYWMDLTPGDHIGFYNRVAYKVKGDTEQQENKQ